MSGSKFSNSERPTTLTLKVRDCAMPLVRFVNHTLAFVAPSGKFVATPLTKTERLLVAPPARIPLVGEILNQALALLRDQDKELVPLFARVNVAGLGVNGPPTGPVTERTAGVICRLSGRS